MRNHGGFRNFRRLLGEEQLSLKTNQWKDLEYTIKQVRLIMKKHGFKGLPSHTKLLELNCSSLATAIQKYYGGFHKFRELLGEKNMRKKPGQWKDLEYTLEQTKKLLEKKGFNTLPTQRKLYELGYSNLARAIQLYHGGLIYFRQLLDRKNGIKPETERLEKILTDYIGENR